MKNCLKIFEVNNIIFFLVIGGNYVKLLRFLIVDLEFFEIIKVFFRGYYVYMVWLQRMLFIIKF